MAGKQPYDRPKNPNRYFHFLSHLAAPAEINAEGAAAKHSVRRMDRCFASRPKKAHEILFFRNRSGQSRRPGEESATCLIPADCPKRGQLRRVRSTPGLQERGFCITQLM
jgi:hypothetical protein